MRKISSVAMASLAVLLVAGACAHAAEAEWPCWRGPNHDSKSPDTGLLKQWPDDGPPKLWELNDIGSGFSSVTVTGGRIYITGKEGDRLILHALDMDGKRLWKVDIDAAYSRSHPGSRASATLDEGNLYLLSGNGLVGCYSAATGKKKWTHHMRDFSGRPGGWGYAESVLIYKDLAIVKPGGNKCIVALDKKTGRTKWTSRGNGGGPEYGSCLPIPYSRGCVIVTGTRSGLVGVSAKSGRVLFTDDWSANNTANCPTPAYSKGHVVWANGYGKGGVCLRLSSSSSGVTATRAWTTRELNCHHGGYIIHEGYVYGNNGGGWICLELKTGKKQWEERGVGKGSVLFADGMLYLFGESGGKAGLATCSPDGMEMKGTFRVAGRGPSWAHPVVIGGRLYLRFDANLYCFNVKE